MKILIVDDQLMFRETLRIMLQPYGACTLAEDGETAVQLFREALQSGEPFRLVLLDILMPGLDGHQTLEKLRQLERERHGSKQIRGKYACILIQTSLRGTEQQMVNTFRKGCNGYVTKPIDEDKLIARLKRLHILSE